MCTHVCTHACTLVCPTHACTHVFTHCRMGAAGNVPAPPSMLRQRAAARQAKGPACRAAPAVTTDASVTSLAAAASAVVAAWASGATDCNTTASKGSLAAEESQQEAEIEGDKRWKFKSASRTQPSHHPESPSPARSPMGPIGGDGREDRVGEVL